MLFERATLCFHRIIKKDSNQKGRPFKEQKRLNKYSVGKKTAADHHHMVCSIRLKTKSENYNPLISFVLFNLCAVYFLSVNSSPCVEDISENEWNKQ